MNTALAAMRKFIPLPAPDTFRRVAPEAARIILAALTAYGVGIFLSLPEPFWGSFAAVVATRGHVEAAWRIGTRRIVGALAGAAWAIAVTVTTRGHLAEGVSLAIVVALPALLAAWKPLYRSALVTALIIMTASAQAAWGIAVLRVAALALGAGTAIFISFVVFPQSAETTAKKLAAAVRRTLLRSVKASRQGEEITLQMDTLWHHLESMNKLASVGGRGDKQAGGTEKLYRAAAKAACSVSVALRLARETDATVPGETAREASLGDAIQRLVRRDLHTLEQALQGKRP